MLQAPTLCTVVYGQHLLLLLLLLLQRRACCKLADQVTPGPIQPLTKAGQGT
jgi:hypothetical protein